MLGVKGVLHPYKEMVSTCFPLLAGQATLKWHDKIMIESSKEECIYCGKASQCYSCRGLGSNGDDWNDIRACSFPVELQH